MSLIPNRGVRARHQPPLIRYDRRAQVVFIQRFRERERIAAEIECNNSGVPWLTCSWSAVPIRLCKRKGPTPTVPGNQRIRATESQIDAVHPQVTIFDVPDTAVPRPKGQGSTFDGRQQHLTCVGRGFESMLQPYRLPGRSSAGAEQVQQLPSKPRHGSELHLQQV